MVGVVLVIALELKLQEIVNVCTWFEIRDLLQN